MGDPVIRIQNYSFRYPGSDEPVLRQVHLDIPEAGFVAIIGSNGSGKSTLCKTFTGLIPHFYNGDYEGSVFILGRDAAQQDVASLAKSVGYVYQDFENQLVRPTVYDEITFAPINYGMADYRRRAEWAMDVLDIRHLQGTYTWQLSGGQKHLVALAGALATDPDIIVVDEPVAQLDPLHARLVYEKLKLLNETYGKTVVVIEHHTEFIARYCRHVVLMDQGTARWVKPTKEALNEIDELRGLNILPPQVTQVALGLRGHGRPATVREPLSSGALLPVTVEEGVALWGRLPHQETPPYHAQRAVCEPGSRVLRMQGVRHVYRTIEGSTVPVLRDVDLELFEGDRVAVVGGNGAGKSTLLKALAGIVRPAEGNITALGHRLRDLPPSGIAEFIAYVYQNPEEMFIADNIRQDIEYFWQSRRMDNRAFIDTLIGQLKLEQIQHRDGRLLSGGQQRRAALAVGLAMKPRILLLDEPTASLDAASRNELYGLLARLHDQVQTVVVATHDMQLVAEWANRVVVMRQGAIAADTDGRSLFGDAALMRQCGLEIPQIVELSLGCRLEPPALSPDEFVERYASAGRGHAIEVC